MKSLVLAMLAAIALPAAAEVERYTIDPNHTFPSFEIGHFTYSIQRGRFDKTTGKATLDPAAHTGSVDVVIDATSIDTGHPKLEEELRKEAWFNVARFPNIAFQGSQFTFDGDNVKSVAGELTMLGVSRPVTLEAALWHCAPHPFLKRKVCGGDFVAKIKRSDFGMKKFLANLADDVTLHINFEAIKDD